VRFAVIRRRWSGLHTYLDFQLLIGHSPPNLLIFPNPLSHLPQLTPSSPIPRVYPEAGTKGFPLDMTNDSQLQANRANAQHSTGPRTDEGKAASSRNALTNGLFTTRDFVQPGEEAEFDEMAATFRAELSPQTLLEQTYVTAIISATWRLRRCSKVEAGMGGFFGLDLMEDRVGLPIQTSVDRARTQSFNILRRSTVPGRMTKAQSDEAKAIARKIAEALDYVGVLAVELFVTKNGALLVNEIAPRVHNSGHWTIEACQCSQFEQHIRAVAGWPLGDPTRHADAVMENVIGAEADAWESLAKSGALHLYGKKDAKPGRKMGHVTRLKPKS